MDDSFPLPPIERSERYALFVGERVSLPSGDRHRRRPSLQLAGGRASRGSESIAPLTTRRRLDEAQARFRALPKDQLLQPLQEAVAQMGTLTRLDFVLPLVDEFLGQLPDEDLEAALSLLLPHRKKDFRIEELFKRLALDNFHRLPQERKGPFLQGLAPDYIGSRDPFDEKAPQTGSIVLTLLEQVPENERAAIAKVVAGLLGKHEVEWNQSYSFEAALKKLLPLVPEDEREGVLEVVVEAMKMKEGLNIRSIASSALVETFPLIPRERRSSFAQKLLSLHWEILTTLSPLLRPIERIELLFSLSECLPLGATLDFRTFFGIAKNLYEGVSSKIHEDFVRANQTRVDSPEGRLYHYLHRGGPDLFEVWNAYRTSPDPAGYLESLQKHVKPYIYGQGLQDPSSRTERLWAYASLDRPQGFAMLESFHFGEPDYAQSLTWDFFNRLLDEVLREQPELAPLFLREGFSFRIPRQTPVHQLIQRNVLNEEVQRLIDVDRWQSLGAWLKRLLTTPPPSLRKELRPYATRRISNSKELFKILREVHTLLASHSGRGDNQVSPARAKILTALAWHCVSNEGLRQVVRRYHTAMRDEEAELASQDLVATLQGLLEFYDDTVPTALRTLTQEGPSRIPKGIREAQERLIAQRERLSQTPGPEALVEILPAKTVLNRFAGFVREDCSTEVTREFFDDDFQTFHMVVDGRLDGVIYARKGRKGTKRGFVIDIGPRMRLNVDHAVLLRKLEAGYGLLAERAGFDLVLISTNPDEQGNRVDMRSATIRRKYPTTGFGFPGSYLFKAHQYHVLFRNGATPPTHETEQISLIAARNP